MKIRIPANFNIQGVHEIIYFEERKIFVLQQVLDFRRFEVVVMIHGFFWSQKLYGSKLETVVARTHTLPLTFFLLNIFTFNSVELGFL